MKVLVVHTRGGVGDILLCTPVLEALKGRFEQVDMMVREGAAGVVRHNPHVDDLRVVQEGVWDHGAAFWHLVRDLRQSRYDAGIVLWSKAPEAWLLFLSGIPVRVGQAGRLLYSFLYTHPVRVRSEAGDTTSHWVDIQLDYVRALNVPTEGVKPHLVVGEEERRQAAALLEGKGSRWVGISVGKGLALTAERWPVEQFARIADAIAAETGGSIVLTGSPEEKVLVDAVVRHMQQPSLNLAGVTNLMQLAGVMSHCEAFVCPDSGPMHMASALGIPTVGIFAMRCEFPQRWRPYGKDDLIVRPDPIVCPVGCQKETCEAFTCYRQLEPESVVAAVRRVLKAGDRPKT